MAAAEERKLPEVPDELVSGADDAPPDHWRRLGVGRDASDDEVNKAFRRLAAALHPDKNPGNAEAARRFVLVSEAHDVLSDPRAKENYKRQAEPIKYADPFVTGRPAGGGGKVDPFAAKKAEKERNMPYNMTSQASRSHHDAIKAGGTRAAAYGDAAKSVAAALASAATKPKPRKEDAREAARRRDPQWKKNICRFWAEGYCRDGADCGWAHGEHELRDHPQKKSRGDIGKIDVDPFGAALSAAAEAKKQKGPAAGPMQGPAGPPGVSPAADTPVSDGRTKQAPPIRQARILAGGSWLCSCGFKNRPTNEKCGGDGVLGCKRLAPEPDPGPISFRPGELVQAYSLVGAAHLNGRTGKVTGRDGVRYVVDFGPPLGPSSLKMENLRTPKSGGVPSGPVEVTLTRHSLDEAMGVDLLPDLTLQGVDPGGPADRAGMGTFITYRLTLVNGQVVTSLSDCAQFANTLSLRFALSPPASVTASSTRDPSTVHGRLAHAREAAADKIAAGGLPSAEELLLLPFDEAAAVLPQLWELADKVPAWRSMWGRALSRTMLRTLEEMHRKISPAGVRSRPAPRMFEPDVRGVLHGLNLPP